MNVINGGSTSVKSADRLGPSSNVSVVRFYTSNASRNVIPVHFIATLIDEHPPASYLRDARREIATERSVFILIERWKLMEKEKLGRRMIFNKPFPSGRGKFSQ